jgi:hypothetical protein
VLAEMMIISGVVNQLIDYQVMAILNDYFNYQFNYLKLASQFQFQLVATGRSIVDLLIENNYWLLNEWLAAPVQ